jgi:Flp pilus assembly pilin Flp
MKRNAKTNTISVGSLKRTRSRRGARGQSLVEYALVFVLVSIVVVVSAAAIGTAVQRLYAIVAGSLGTQINNSNSAEHVIDIEDGKQFCVVVPSAPPDYPDGATVLNFTGTTQIPIAELTVSTDTGLLFTAGGDDTPFHSAPTNRAQGWMVYYILANKADAGRCPRTVVLQSQHKDIAIGTVQVLIQ